VSSLPFGGATAPIRRVRLRIRLILLVITLVWVMAGTSCSSSDNPQTGASAPPAAPATGSPGGEPFSASVLTPAVGSVLTDPIPVPATDAKIHLAYELLLMNASGQEVQLTSVAAVADGKTLLEHLGEGLAYWTRVLGTENPTTTLPVGAAAIVTLDVTVDEPADAPATIEHTIGVSLAQPEPPVLPATVSATMAPTTVQTRKPVTISPPLYGPNWVNSNGCCSMTPHRMAVGPINGQLLNGERFANDYEQLTSDGRLFNGDVRMLESYAYYGADVHAVADGPVVAVVDGRPQEIPGAPRSEQLLNQRGGNHIVQDIGGGNYAFYAHLKSGSITVEPGDQLTTGQTFGQVGNSGHTIGPHLHFEVMNAPDQLRANGLPFMFKSFRVDSRIVSQATLESLLFQTAGPAPLQSGFTASDPRDVMPLHLDVMTFPTG
jgi:hypothetical protein